jgi:hypothetical protein
LISSYSCVFESEILFNIIAVDSDFYIGLNNKNWKWFYHKVTIRQSDEEVRREQGLVYLSFIFTDFWCDSTPFMESQKP